MRFMFSLWNNYSVSNKVTKIFFKEIMSSVGRNVEKLRLTSTVNCSVKRYFILEG